MLNLKNFWVFWAPYLCIISLTLTWFWVHSPQPNHPWFQFRAKICWMHKLHELPQLERWGTSCGFMHRKRRGHAIGDRLNHACSECAWRETERTSMLLCASGKKRNAPLEAYTKRIWMLRTFCQPFRKRRRSTNKWSV